jgi:hypothetical protein
VAVAIVRSRSSLITPSLILAGRAQLQWLR